MADNLTPKQRSYCMSRVKGKDTGIEIRLRSELHKRGLRFRKHVKRLPGTPDIVFVKARVVVFVDGDFWHGYRFAAWEQKMSEFWRRKIRINRDRDTKNRRALRSQGWEVVRLWQHQVEQDLDACVRLVLATVDAGLGRNCTLGD